MSSLLKSTVLGLALLGGVAATAHAQSVSALPPTSPATAPTPAYSSTSKIYPNPGNNVTWQEQHYQGNVQDPYSHSIGPQPGSQSALTPLPGEHGTQADNSPGQHPYTTPHFGPAPN